MEKDNDELKKFLEAQLKKRKTEFKYSDEIDFKLHEMKRIAEYAMVYELTSVEVAKLNDQLDTLKNPSCQALLK
ncbi:hypothetical protein ACI2OX_05080 [Bacillus sp. N9]